MTVIFETDLGGSVCRDVGECNRCGRRCVEVARFVPEDTFYNLSFCLMSCWPQLVDAVGAARPLEK